MTWCLIFLGQPQPEGAEWWAKRPDYQPEHPGRQELDVSFFLRLPGSWDQLRVSHRGTWHLLSANLFSHEIGVSSLLTSVSLFPVDGGCPQTGGDQLQITGLHRQNHCGHYGVKPFYPRGQIDTMQPQTVILQAGIIQDTWHHENYQETMGKKNDLSFVLFETNAINSSSSRSKKKNFRFLRSLQLSNFEFDISWVLSPVTLCVNPPEHTWVLVTSI